MKTYRDHYFLKAKQENYPARSVYKLKEMDARFKLIQPGFKVLDLGAAPGSWTLYAAQKVGLHGRVISCDIQEVETEFPKNVSYFQEDVFERTAEFNAILAELAPFDFVMSDMAPRTTGTKFTDQARSLELCLESLAVAEEYLVAGGNFITKIFMGPDFQDLAQAMKKSFTKVRTYKPKSSRPESKEIFVMGTGYKGRPEPQNTSGDSQAD